MAGPFLIVGVYQFRLLSSNFMTMVEHVEKHNLKENTKMAKAPVTEHKAVDALVDIAERAIAFRSRCNVAF